MILQEIPKKKLNKREVFNHVKEHLLTQGKRCIDEFGDCFYRRGNLACAAGSLMPDSLYHETMEHIPCGDIPEFYEIINGKDEMALLKNLQSIHDSFPVESWVFQLDQLEKTIE